ncbi:FMN-binding protein [Amycolatopsis sp. NBC_00345]|uniref:FMN-binding protein n=1 Tax=Amycolatopsis sp. NBC_00345 TaxID=2975955 RepID=UPI002E256632
MRRIALAIAATVSIVVLLFSYHTSTGGDAVVTSSPVARQRPASPSAGATSAAPASPGAAAGAGTFTGTAADTRYGPVQVRIVVSGGRITDAQAVQVPDESGRDVRINSAAVPTLVQETLQAQSAQIDTVSGATYTSEGYTQSLQSALDQAHH